MAKKIPNPLKAAKMDAKILKNHTRAVEARDRRILRWGARVEYLGQRWQKNFKMTVKARLMLVGQLLRDRIVINIAIPVTKYRNNRGTISVTDRSKPGEYPRADTTRLMKDVFWKLMDNEREVRVGTTLDYGFILETQANRSFLLRTFRETQHVLANALTKGKGASMTVQTSQGGGGFQVINIPPV